jgi:hypothetical protein
MDDELARVKAIVKKKQGLDLDSILVCELG